MLGPFSVPACDLGDGNLDLIEDLVWFGFMVSRQKEILRGAIEAMPQVNVHKARTHLFKLLTRVAAGEEIVSSKAGKPVARLVPREQDVKQRIPGLDKGLRTVPEDFDSPLPKDVLDAFES